jgi:hypothetical protein
MRTRGVIAVGRLFVFGICLTDSEHSSRQLSAISFQPSAPTFNRVLIAV